ncbi:unnamed protein product [Euphydryas editha]|uniref:PiggyBac transposable element-derived protein 4 C-terminal zinc-ribbon domain-containing protein n=1 Tax=Euphydryas editha TaxID=104508 RepID=A0AAU9ULK9_EUPED|nr:unnamed protein product [Euphydryas editha]
MANRNVFTSYKRLEEALESIMADESNDEEYDMVLVPPDPAVVSDEEEGNEDNLAASRFPMDVPGTIEVGRRHPDYDVSELSDSDRRIIARTYLRPTKTKSRPSSSAALGGRNNNGHNPERMENPLRCVICHQRIRWRCEICLKTLCVERPCFKQFHS